MKILYVLHAPFELPGIIESWAAERGYSQSYICLYDGENITRSFDLLVVMGGPQSALDHHKIPYLAEEIRVIREALKAKIPVLGFCLGAQLMGEALGASAERSPFKEVGIFPIQLTEEGMRDPFFAKLPSEFETAHWHNDMPGLTKEAVVLATSAGCPRQIVRYAPHAFGFQCHPEMTRQGAEALITNCPEDLKSGQYVQTAEEILSHDFDPSNQKMVHFLEDFIRTNCLVTR